MRLAMTADLHWGLSRPGDRATRELVEQLRTLEADALVIAGDIGEGAEFSHCLSQFAGVECARLLVPGNHDLWTRSPLASSLLRYEDHLPRLAAEHGFAVLDAAPWLSGDGREALVGSINWYDYSFADPALEALYPDVGELYAAKLFPDGRHNDRRFVHLGMSDREFTALVVERFIAQMANLPLTVAEVVAVQHHPPIRQLFYPRQDPTAAERFWLAYTGNRRMEEAVLSDPRIRWVVCGHTHAFRSEAVGGVQCRNLGGDYDWKQLLLLDTRTGTEQWWKFGR